MTQKQVASVAWVQCPANFFYEGDEDKYKNMIVLVPRETDPSHPLIYSP